MQYHIYRRPDERFTAQVSVVTELAEGVRGVTQTLAPHVEVCHLVTPVADGTRLELACRWPARVEKSVGKKNMAADVARRLQEMVEGYKALIEEPA